MHAAAAPITGERHDGERSAMALAPHDAGPPAAVMPALRTLQRRGKQNDSALVIQSGRQHPHIGGAALRLAQNDKPSLRQPECGSSSSLVSSAQALATDTPHHTADV